jgi:uncharacterized protein (DUF2345 family)
VTVGEDQIVKVTGNQTVVIEGKGNGEIQSAVSVTGNHFVEASESIQLKAEKTITLVCGRSWIQMEPGRITLQAGDGAGLVLDDKGIMAAAAGGRVALDADAYLQAIAGNQVLIDANAPTKEGEIA